MQVLLFELNGEEYGILLKDVAFVSEKVNVVKVPDAPEAVSGIAMLRDKLVPVYSLASLFGFVEQESRYLLVIKVDDIRIALEVTKVNRVIYIGRESVALLPSIIRATQMCFREVVIYEKKLIRLLDISGLVTRQDRGKLRLAIKRYVEKITPAEGI